MVSFLMRTLFLAMASYGGEIMSLLIGAVTPLIRVPTSKCYYITKVLLLNIIRVEIRSRTYEFGEGTQAFSP